MVRITKRALVFGGVLLIDIILARIFKIKFLIATPMTIISLLLATQWVHMVYTNNPIVEPIEDTVRKILKFINRRLN